MSLGRILVPTLRQPCARGAKNNLSDTLRRTLRCEPTPRSEIPFGILNLLMLRSPLREASKPESSERGLMVKVGHQNAKILIFANIPRFSPVRKGREAGRGSGRIFLEFRD